MNWFLQITSGGEFGLIIFAKSNSSKKVSRNYFPGKIWVDRQYKCNLIFTSSFTEVVCWVQKVYNASTSSQVLTPEEYYLICLIFLGFLYYGWILVCQQYVNTNLLNKIDSAKPILPLPAPPENLHWPSRNTSQISLKQTMHQSTQT